MKENVDDYFTGDFLKAADITAPATVTIRKIDEVEIDDETKVAVYFAEISKCLVLNKTNADKISDIAASGKFADWVGKKIVLYPAVVPYKGKDVPAIRISEPASQGA